MREEQSMNKAIGYLFLLLMFFNLTIFENGWTLGGLRIDQVIYAITIFISLYVANLTRYRYLVAGMLILYVLLRAMYMVSGGEVFHDLGIASLAVVFAVAGSIVYGRDPALLRKVLVAYLALCVPIMILQILGVHSFFMGWNIGYAHDPTLLSLDEVGTFREVPVYPTLFVGIEDLMYSIGQSRPVGLMYGSNPLSVFISIAVAINLAITRTSRITWSDVIVTLAVVLAMSKLAFGVIVILYAFFIAFKSFEKRQLALKLAALFGFLMLLYYSLFPGLFVANLSESMIMTSVMLRLIDLLNSMGLQDYFGYLTYLSEVYRPSFVYEVGEGYSGVATLLRSKVLIPAIVVMAAGSIVYLKGIRRMAPASAMVYVATLIACVLTQFAVPFAKTPSFQVVMGFSLYPLFNLWALSAKAKRERAEGYAEPVVEAS